MHAGAGIVRSIALVLRDVLKCRLSAAALLDKYPKMCMVVDEIINEVGPAEACSCCLLGGQGCSTCGACRAASSTARTACQQRCPPRAQGILETTDPVVVRKALKHKVSPGCAACVAAAHGAKLANAAAALRAPCTKPRATTPPLLLLPPQHAGRVGVTPAELPGLKEGTQRGLAAARPRHWCCVLARAPLLPHATPKQRIGDTLAAGTLGGCFGGL